MTTLLKGAVSAATVICVVTAALSGCGGPAAPPPADTAELARQWRDAISVKDIPKAIEFAEQITGNHSAQQDVPPDPYVQLCLSNGLSPDFLTASFNRWDCLSWYQAFFLKKLADDITEGQEDEVRALFDAVVRRMKKKATPRVLPWPFLVWQLQTGACDQQAWLLCELAYQRGYRAHVVYLRDPETLVSPHTICEIRKGDNCWVADPYSEVFLADTAVSDFLRNEDLAIETWPERKDWHAAISKPHFWTPSMPQDYCARNQLLQQKIAPHLADGCPRFGEPPSERIAAYRALLTPPADEVPVELWFCPFKMLGSQFASVAE